MGSLSKEGQHPSTGAPTYQIIKVTNVNHMSMMKTNLTIILMCPRESFALYKSRPSLYFAIKIIGPPCYTLVTFVTWYPLRIILSHNYLLPIISVLAENTLLKTACHFLLLLVGFDTLIYWKDYNWSHILVGHQLHCWKRLVISFCSLLGSTLLLIERTTIDSLYLWVIKTLFWRRCRGVKRLW